MYACVFYKHWKFSQNCHWFVAKQCTHDSQSFPPDKGVSVTVCLSAWMGIENDLIQFLKTTFSLATYESSCAAMDYFSCPQCEWDECLQRPLHNKGSLFLWVDVRPSQQGVLCETDDLGPFLTRFVFPSAGSFYTDQIKIGSEAVSGVATLSICLFTEGNLPIFKSACFVDLLGHLISLPVCLDVTSASISWPACECDGKRAGEIFILRVCLSSVTYSR